MLGEEEDDNVSLSTKIIAGVCLLVGATAGGFIAGYKKGQPDEDPDDAYDRGYEDGKELRPSRVEEGAKKVVEKGSAALERGSRFFGRLRRGFKEEQPAEAPPEPEGETETDTESAQPE